MFFKEERHAAGSKIEVLLYRFLQYRPISKCYNKGVDKIEVGYQSKASEFMKFRRLFAVLEKRNRYGNETPHTRASDSWKNGKGQKGNLYVQWNADGGLRRGTNCRCPESSRCYGTPLYAERTSAKRNLLCHWKMYRLCHDRQRRSQCADLCHSSGGGHADPDAIRRRAKEGGLTI